jgi:hypothetical protein
MSCCSARVASRSPACASQCAAVSRACHSDITRDRSRTRARPRARRLSARVLDVQASGRRSADACNRRALVFELYCGASGDVPSSTVRRSRNSSRLISPPA